MEASTSHPAQGDYPTVYRPEYYQGLLKHHDNVLKKVASILLFSLHKVKLINHNWFFSRLHKRWKNKKSTQVRSKEQFTIKKCSIISSEMPRLDCLKVHVFTH